MRRESRKPNRYKTKSLSDKIIIYSSIAVAILSAILIGLILYSRQLSKDIAKGTIDLSEISKMNETSEENTQSASSEMGKTVEESKQETNTVSDSNTTNTEKTSIAINTNSNTNTQNNSNTETTNTITETTNATSTEATNAAQSKKELSFAKPVDGEIMKEYAKDNLVYSETLEEWVTHLGIDIKAEKTTVVKAAEEGTVKSIKNDPRYGLTVVIEHEDGYQTIYSNLLTAEFIVEGEKVEKGQTIGTVGNTAAFESAEEAHLHFEILKDSIGVDPNIYLK